MRRSSYFIYLIHSQTESSKKANDYVSGRTILADSGWDSADGNIARMVLPRASQWFPGKELKSVQRKWNLFSSCIAFTPLRRKQYNLGTLHQDYLKSSRFTVLGKRKIIDKREYSFMPYTNHNLIRSSGKVRTVTILI